MTLSYLVIFLVFLIPLGTTFAFADHSEVTIDTAAGSGAPGCEETTEGCYIPSTAIVDVGGVVIMTNSDTAAHTYTSGDPGDGPDGIFDTSLIMAGGSFEWSPSYGGEYPYFCMVHPWMEGIIIVQGPGSPDDHNDDHPDHPIPTPDNVLIDLEIDDDSYRMGDDLEIQGKVTPSDGSTVIIQIINPRGEMIVNDRMTTSPTGYFEKDYKIAGHDWRHNGIFTITAISGSASEKTSFSFNNKHYSSTYISTTNTT